MSDRKRRSLELEELYSLIRDDLDKVKERIGAISRVDFNWLSEQLGYVVKSSGKGIRPALTLLSGKFYRYNLEYLLAMAASVELMHTATLVHDDAIDKSNVRRGQATIYKIWGEEAAVLLGDYLFAKAGEAVSDTQSPRVIKLFSQTLAVISGGELSQLLGAFQTNQNRENYFQRISGKTASLFSLSTESGSILSEAPETAIRSLKGYGYNLGIAFQVVDDILDFVSDEDTLGKPVGSDLAHGTLTLPAMLLMEHYPEDNPVKEIFEGIDRERNTTRAIEMVRNSTIADECYKIASDYCDHARQNLRELPENSNRAVMETLADYILIREK